MNSPRRAATDEPERIVLANIAEYGWHCVNVLEDDGNPSPSGRAVRASCPRSTTAAQRRDSGPPHGLRPLTHPWVKALA
jgi:hypothetical protein